MTTKATADPRIQFTCPHCGKALKADPPKVGKRALCTGCGKGVLVPGLAEPPPKPALEIGDLQASRPPLEEVELDDDAATKINKISGDTSAGPASLYLGAVNFVLFMSVTMMAGLLVGFGKPGLALLGALGISGVIMAWRGWQLAQQAKRLADATGHGMGYAIAGRWSHGLIATNYLCVLALVGFGFYLESQKGPGVLGGGGLGGLGNIGDLLKPLVDQKKEADKLIDEINRR